MLLNMALGLLGGALFSLQLSMNAYAGVLSGNPRYANVFFWFIGLVTALLAASPTSDPGFVERAGAVPLWLCLAGVIGAALSLVANLAIPRIGIAGLSLLMILGQLLAAAVFSHWGFLASQREPLSTVKGLGIGLAALGTLLFLYGGRLSGKA